VKNGPDSLIRLSIVVPCYNEEAVINLTYADIVDTFKNEPFELEVVFVDDGSKDRTLEILRGFSEENPLMRVVSLARNFGHQAAVSAGLTVASGDVIAVIDADLQDPPSEIIGMLERWKNGAEVVYAVRQERKESVIKRGFYAGFYRLMSGISDFEFPHDSGDFALMDRRVVDVLNSLPEKNRFIRGLRAWIGFTQVAHPYARQARQAGDTKYPFRKLLKLAFDGIFNFSTVPLTIIFMLGVAATVLAAFVSLALLVHKISGLSFFGLNYEDLPGFTSIILVILFFSGIQIASIGILGEYIGRMYQESKQRPSYIIRDVNGQIRDVNGQPQQNQKPINGDEKDNID